MQVIQGLYRCHQCGGDFKEEDFSTYDACCYECLDTEDDYEDVYDEDEDDY